MQLYRLAASLALLPLLLPPGRADIRSCLCDLAKPETMEARDCSLCRTAETYPADPPFFFIRDAIKFPDLVHAFKPDPVTNRQDARRIFDFLSLTPESMHMVTWLFSPWGIPANYREMRGSGVNTYKMVNAEGEAVIYPQRAEECLVARDPDSPEIILWATKLWRVGKRFRLNIYYADKVEKYATVESTQENLTWPQSEAALFPYSDDDGGPSIPNDFASFRSRRRSPSAQRRTRR